MLEILVVLTFVVLVCSIIFQYRSYRNSREELQEYKNLFEKSDSLYKESQVKLETLYQDLNRQQLLLERSSQSLELANTKISEQGTLICTKEQEYSGLKSALEFQEEQYAKLLGQKKSSETRLGQISEQLAPFLKDYPFPPETGSFLGKPIDMLHFLPDKIVFVEIKSGGSQLSTKQRRIRDLVKKGKVEFIIYRIEGKS